MDASRTPLSLRLDFLGSDYGPTIEIRFVENNGSRRARATPTGETEVGWSESYARDVPSCKGTRGETVLNPLA